MRSVTEMGAIGDGHTDCTEVFQRAFRWVASGQGRRLHVPAGRYLTGPWDLPTGLDIHLDARAFIQFTPDFGRYPPVWNRWEGLDCYSCHPLVFAQRKNNISIHGEGILDGSGQAWWDAYRRLREGRSDSATDTVRGLLSELNQGSKMQPSGGGGRDLNFLRPPLMQFLSCGSVRVEGLTLQNSPFWNTHVVYSRDVQFKSVRFLNPPDAPNTDGLDIDSCEDVLVRACMFDVGDDCLAVKSGANSSLAERNKACENISIEDCSMRSGHGGIVIGSETAGGIRKVRARDCTMRSTDRGIRIKTRRGRGGTVEDMEFVNIDIQSCKCPIVINSYYRCGADPSNQSLFGVHPKAVDAGTPRIRNIRIQNLCAADCRSSAGFIVGLPEAPIQDLLLENCSISMSAPEQRIAPSESAMFAGLEQTESEMIRLEFVERTVFRDVRVDGVDIRVAGGAMSMRQPSLKV